jgi:hypothetical protein
MNLQRGGKRIGDVEKNFCYKGIHYILGFNCYDAFLRNNCTWVFIG